MNIRDCTPLRAYAQVQPGDLFYTHLDRLTHRGLCPVTGVEAEQFTYNFELGEGTSQCPPGTGASIGLVHGDELKDALLLRVSSSGTIEVLAGENILRELTEAAAMR